MWFLSPLFIEGLLQKPSSSHQTPADWSTAVTSHAAVNSDARDSLLKIFEYAAKQACKQLQCNKAKLSEPASINGLLNIRVYAEPVY